MAMRCGRCDQLKMILEGKEVGELIPEHWETCPERKPEPTEPPRIEISTKARDVLQYINQQGLTEMEMAEVLAALLLSRI